MGPHHILYYVHVCVLVICMEHTFRQLAAAYDVHEGGIVRTCVGNGMLYHSSIIMTCKTTSDYD